MIGHKFSDFYRWFVLLLFPVVLMTSCGSLTPAYASEIGVHGSDYHGAPKPVQDEMFDHLERYNLDLLYSVMFEDRDYIVLEWFDSVSSESHPVKGYSFVLFDEDVSIVTDDDLVAGEDNNYRLDLGKGVTDSNVVDTSVNFIVDEEGKLAFSYEGTALPPGVDHAVLEASYGTTQLLIYGSTATINYGSYSTNIEGRFVNHHWLKIKDYSVRVGRLTDYERILTVAVFFVGWAFVRFFKFRS